MLLYHEVDSLLCIVKIELVILSLLLLFCLFFIVLVRIAQPLGLSSILHRDRRAKLHFRLWYLALGSIQDFLLQLQLLTHLSGFIGPRVVLPVTGLKEGHSFCFLILRGLRLRRQVIEEHERRI